MRARPSYRCATGTVPLTTQTASSAITSNSARGSPPRKASKTRRMLSSASAFKGSHRQAVPLELPVVELGELAVPRPHHCLTGGVNLVRERHAAVVIDAGDRLREREGNTLERVVVVVENDHPPRVAGTGAGVAACPFPGRCHRARHNGASE